MSGRPADPSYTPVVWDSGNYSAGTDPWSGTLKRVDPGYRSWTPKLKAAAQWLNFFFGSILDIQASQKTDATNLLELVGQNPAANWGPKVTVDATKQLSRAVWSKQEQAWYAVGSGSTDWAMVSFDFGRTWNAPTLGSLLTILDVAVDTTGNVVMIASGTRNTYKGTFTAGFGVAFAQVVNALSVASISGSVAWDDVNGNYIAFYRGSTGLRVDTSIDGATWTSRTIPATFTGYTGTGSNQHIRCGNGVAIASFYDEVNSKFHIMRSTLGGTSWTEVFAAAITVPPSATAVPKPCCDLVTGNWYIVIGSSGSGDKTSVMKSTDGGVTWSEVKTFTTSGVALMTSASLGTLLVAASEVGVIYYSLDGINWFQIARNNVITAGTTAFLGAGGGGLLLMLQGDKASYSSHRFGNDPRTVT